MVSAPKGPPAADPVAAAAGDADGQRAEALDRGVQAVVEAMAGEARFTNDNEAAFALLRQGCRHCARLPTALEAVGPKAVVVTFLGRVAARRTAARQLQELGAILVQAAGWRRLLAGSPPPLCVVLGADPPLRAALAAEAVAAAAAARQSARPSAEPPGRNARVFLRERTSQRFLSVVEPLAPERCVMTEKAASLFVCHAGARSPGPEEAAGEWDANGSDACSADEEEKASWPAAHEDEAGAATLGFEHEGVPAFGHFLGCRRPWMQAPLRNALMGGGEPQLCCSGRRFGRREEFLWFADDTLQHALSGLWLFVDPAAPDQVLLRAWEKSAWEALPAI